MRRNRTCTRAAAVLAAATLAAVLGVPAAGAADPLPPPAEPIGEGHVCEGAPEQEPFDAVDQGDPSWDEIRCAWATALASGTSETTYTPNASVTRRQMAVFVVRMIELANSLELEDLQDLPAYEDAPPYSDLADENDTFREAIGRLSDAGIVGGFSDGTFRPDAPVSRRQMAAFQNRAQQFLVGEPFPDAGDFFDDDDGDPGEDDLDALAGVGVFQGEGGARVRPGGLLTRRQMANIMLRHLEVLFQDGAIDHLFELSDG